jgi:hypothetical protein
MWLCIIKPKPFSLSWITNWVSFLFLILLVKLQLLCFCSVSSCKKNRIKRVQVWTFMDQSCSTSFTRKAFVLLWNTLSFFTKGSLLQHMVQKINCDLSFLVCEFHAGLHHIRSPTHVCSNNWWACDYYCPGVNIQVLWVEFSKQGQKASNNCNLW